MNKTILVALTVFLASYATSTGAFEAGEHYLMGAYCTTLEATKKLVTAAILDNNQGYNRVMTDKNVKCYDVRFLPGVSSTARTDVTLRSRAFTITRSDGEMYEFWLAVDSRGNEGYVWFPVSKAA